jgi:4-amino-4-deoxy-L-arabinose transferase-like glycosyltransferase
VKGATPRLRDALRDRWLLAMLGAGLLLRVGVAVLADARQVLRGDEANYVAYATALAESGVLGTGPFVRPPLYFAFLAALELATPDAAWLLVVKLVQCALGAATAIPVYRSALRIGGRRVARLAAAILLFDPPLVGYAPQLWPETLYGALVALVFDQLAGLEQRRPAALAALGLAIGAAILLKPVFGLFALLLAGSWLRHLGARAALRLALVVGGAAALVVVPWVLRNTARYGTSILIENQGPYNLWIGNDPAPPIRLLDEWRAIDDPVERSRVATERGLAAIRADPGRFAALSAVRAVNLWGLEFFVVRLAIIGEYGELSRASFLALFWLLQAAYAAKLLAASAGLARASRDPTLRLLLVFAAAFTLLVSAMTTTTRFRVPFALPISICAALGIERLAQRRLGAREAAAIAAAIAVLGASLARPVFRQIASGRFAATAELDREDWRFFRY